jgi:hypothetical protein
MFYYVTAYS